MPAIVLDELLFDCFDFFELIFGTPFSMLVFSFSSILPRDLVPYFRSGFSGTFFCLFFDADDLVFTGDSSICSCLTTGSRSGCDAVSQFSRIGEAVKSNVKIPKGSSCCFLSWLKHWSRKMRTNKNCQSPIRYCAISYYRARSKINLKN